MIRMAIARQRHPGRRGRKVDLKAKSPPQVQFGAALGSPSVASLRGATARGGVPERGLPVDLAVK